MVFVCRFHFVCVFLVNRHVEKFFRFHLEMFRGSNETIEKGRIFPMPNCVEVLRSRRFICVWSLSADAVETEPHSQNSHRKFCERVTRSCNSITRPLHCSRGLIVPFCLSDLHMKCRSDLKTPCKRIEWSYFIQIKTNYTNCLLHFILFFNGCSETR